MRSESLARLKSTAISGIRRKCQRDSVKCGGDTGANEMKYSENNVETSSAESVPETLTHTHTAENGQFNL